MLGSPKKCAILDARSGSRLYTRTESIEFLPASMDGLRESKRRCSRSATILSLSWSTYARLERKDLSDLVHSCAVDRTTFIDHLRLLARYAHSLVGSDEHAESGQVPYAHGSVDRNRTPIMARRTLLAAPSNLTAEDPGVPWSRYLHADRVRSAISDCIRETRHTSHLHSAVTSRCAHSDRPYRVLQATLKHRLSLHARG